MNAPKAPLPEGDDGSANRYPVRTPEASYFAERFPESAALLDSDDEFGPRLWDADPDVCCSAFQLGACVHTESFDQDDETICGKSYAGYGACVRSQGHDESLCRDAFGYTFVGKREVGR